MNLTNIKKKLELYKSFDLKQSNINERIEKIMNNRK